MKENNKNLKKRPITSTFAFISFIYLVPSGILVHFVDHGLKQLDHIAGPIHWTSAMIFLVSAVIHLILNWKSMKRYMFSELKNLLVFRKEFLIVLSVVTLLVAFAGVHGIFL